MNVLSDSALNQCTGCQLCAAVCHKNAITIAPDVEGFYRPSIDPSLCVDCGLCTKICYKFDENIEPFGIDKLRTTTLYGASAKQRDIVENTTSGGVADLLAQELIHEGYRVVGVVYDSSDDCAKDFVASTVEESVAFRGSKYIQSYTLDAFKTVVKNCRQEKFAVFGTPCHIYALDRYLRLLKVRDNFILIDLYCHGCPSIHVWKKYVKGIKKSIGRSIIDNANFRSKVKGWGSSYILEVDVDGHPVFYSDSKNNEFFELFFSDQVLNEACHDCSLRGTLAYTDIRLGDFWGKQYVLNNKGVSAVSLVSETAKQLFERIADRVHYREEKYEDFLPWQSWGKQHKPNPELRRILLQQLSDDNVSLRESVDTIYRQQSLKRRLIRQAKKLIRQMPISWEKRIKWLFYKL